MNAEPLPKAIYDTAKKLEVNSITLHFSGGHDEGYLNIDIDTNNNDNEVGAFESEVETWAWEVYQYSGGGSGNDFGDDIEYNLIEGTATSSSWYNTRVEGESDKGKLTIE